MAPVTRAAAARARANDAELRELVATAHRTQLRAAELALDAEKKAREAAALAKVAAESAEKAREATAAAALHYVDFLAWKRQIQPINEWVEKLALASVADGDRSPAGCWMTLMYYRRLKCSR